MTQSTLAAREINWRSLIDSQSSLITVTEHDDWLRLSIKHALYTACTLSLSSLAAELCISSVASVTYIKQHHYQPSWDNITWLHYSNVHSTAAWFVCRMCETKNRKKHDNHLILNIILVIMFTIGWIDSSHTLTTSVKYELSYWHLRTSLLKKILHNSVSQEQVYNVPEIINKDVMKHTEIIS